MSLISLFRMGLGLTLALTLTACAEDPPVAKAKPAPKMEVPGSPPPSVMAAMTPEPAAEEAAEDTEAAVEEVSLTIADGDATNGAAKYALLCASCHGAGGAGDGPVAAGLNPPPTNHTDDAYMASLSDDHLFKVVKEGGGAVGKSVLMAPWGGTLNDKEIWDVVAHMRTLHN